MFTATLNLPESANQDEDAGGSDIYLIPLLFRYALSIKELFDHIHHKNLQHNFPKMRVVAGSLPYLKYTNKHALKSITFAISTGSP